MSKLKNIMLPIKRVTLLRFAFFYLLLTASNFAAAQQSVELNAGWKCAPIAEVKDNGNFLSKRSSDVTLWFNGTVPGTVLTTLLANKKIPDPFWGMNNKKIKDIYETGRDYYTYWFVKNLICCQHLESNGI